MAKAKTELDILLEDPKYFALYKEEEVIADVGEQIAAFMKTRGLTIKDLSKECGVKVVHIKSFLQGDDIFLRDLVKIYRALGYSMHVATFKLKQTKKDTK